jgi:nucleotide-binding universal stress UspA family protein
MRKILLAFDGVHFSEGSFNFAKQLNEKNKILLTGVFLPQVSYANLWTYADGVGTPMFVPAIDDNETQLIEENIKKFEDLCMRNDIEFRVRKDFSDLALPELKKESRFADLMIIGEEKFYENMGSGNPNNYLRETLHSIECSVILVPEKYTFPTLNVLTYDGSESSVFAIKQFVYLLPEFCNNPTFLTYVNIDGAGRIPNEAYIEELAARHFPDLTISKVNIESKSQFATWVADKKASIIVAGSFGRTAVSQLFSRSFVLDVIKDHKIPIFICHK